MSVESNPKPPRLGQTGYVHWQGQRLPCQIRNGQVWVYLPFRIDRARLRQLLQDSLYAVGWDRERLDSEAWGLAHDVEGYYPYWTFPDPENPRQTVFAFPPRDYQDAVDQYKSSGPDEEQAYLVPEGKVGVEAATELHIDPGEPNRITASRELFLEISETLAPEIPDPLPDSAAHRSTPLPKSAAIGPGAEEEVAHWLPLLWQARQ